MRFLLVSFLLLGVQFQALGFSNGPSTDPSYFPIAVWLQGSQNIARYQAIGINMYVGLWNGPTQSQLQDLKNANMPVICDQNAYALANRSTYGSVIKGWMHGDEPDNAQWNEATQTYDPCIDTSVIKADYAAWRAQDSTRPVYLNLGQGVSYITWVGRGACTGNTRMYPGYIRGCDIVSYDIYPVNSEYASVRDNLWYVPKGVDSLRKWSGNAKPVWCWIECTAISTNQKPAPAQVRSEVWMALIHGAKGFGYFCHSWYPSFVEAGLLADTAMKNGVAAINAQVRALAPVLNAPAADNVVTVASSSTSVPVDALSRFHGDSLYIFAAAMRAGATSATFTLKNTGAGPTVDVIGESRTVAMSGSTFSDAFSGYGVHLYRVRASSARVMARSTFHIRRYGPATFSIYALNGRQVRKFMTTSSGETFTANFKEMSTGLTGGIYLCAIYSRDGLMSLKRIVKR